MISIRPQECAGYAIVVLFAGLNACTPSMRPTNESNLTQNRRAHALTARPTYHLVQTIALSGDGGSDFLSLDEVARRLFISRASRVQVIDIDRGAAFGEVQNTPGVHMVAFVPDLDRGFTSNSEDTSVTVFDLRSLSRTRVVKLNGVGPDAIIYEPVSKRVFTFNERTADVTAIDAATSQVVGTIYLGSHAESAVPDGRGNMFVNLPFVRAIVVLNALTLSRQSLWPLNDCRVPHGIAFDSVGHRLFVGCAEELMIVNANNGNVLAQIRTGGLADQLAFDPALRLIFVPGGAQGDTLHVIQQTDPDHYAVEEAIPTFAGGVRVVVDAASHRAFLVQLAIDSTHAPQRTVRGSLWVFGPTDQR